MLFVALKKQLPLLAFIINTRRELEHSIPEVCKGDLSLNQILEHFDQREVYITLCRQAGISSISDLLQLDNHLNNKSFAENPKEYSMP